MTNVFFKSISVMVSICNSQILYVSPQLCVPTHELGDTQHTTSFVGYKHFFAPSFTTKKCPIP
jgi:hypothetical protein